MRLSHYRTRAVAHAVAFGIGYLLVAGLNVLLTREAGNVALLWPANGLLLGALLRQDPPDRWPALAGAAIGNLAANLLHGDGALASCTMSALNMLEVASGVTLVEALAGPRFRLDSLRRLAAMVAASVAVPAVGAAFAAALLSPQLGAAPAALTLAWWSGDALGMLLFMPIALSVDAGAALRRVRRPLDRTGLVAAMEAVGTVGALLALAWLAVQLRFGGGVALFTPVLLWLALRRGVAATSFAAAFVAVGSALAVPTGAWPEVAGLTGAAATAVGFQTLLLILALPPLTVAVVVAERERARLEHARSAQRYALALDAAGSGFWEWDLAGGRIETDARWAAALGFAPGARRASLRDFEAGVDPDHRGGVAEILAGLEQGRGEFAGAEFRLALPGPEGAAVWVAMSGRVVERDASGRPLRALGTLGDITGRKDAEATLEAATRDNALYRAMVEALPDCLNVKDTEGRFLAANSATARLMGAASADDLLGRTDFDFYPPELAQSYRCDELSTIACGTTLVLEQETRSDEGACGWLCSLKAPFIDAGGNIVGLVTHNRDVTEQKRLQLKLERTKQQLDDAVASMADGFALFNADDRLVLCNERCRQLFPKSAALRVPGIPLRLLMREAARLGEYAGVDETNAAGWIAARLALLDAGQRQEVELAGGRWIEPLSTRTVDGGRIVVYREVTERKRLEGELLAAKRRLD